MFLEKQQQRKWKNNPIEKFHITGQQGCNSKWKTRKIPLVGRSGRRKRHPKSYWLETNREGKGVLESSERKINTKICREGGWFLAPCRLWLELLVVALDFRIPRRVWIIEHAPSGEGEYLWTPCMKRSGSQLVVLRKLAFWSPYFSWELVFKFSSKHPPQTLKFDSRMKIASKCVCCCLWLGGESFSQAMFPCRFKYKYLLVLV